MKYFLCKPLSIILIVAHIIFFIEHDFALASGEATGPFFQKDTQAPGNQFNSVLQAVSSDIFTGMAQLSLPINIPSAAGNIIPPLNITYNSSSGNGLVGVGWSLDLGAISRSTKKGISYHNFSDIFVAQGQELVSLGYNKDRNEEFRAEIESAFIKYIHSPWPSATGSWKAIDKNGTKYFFGSTSASCIMRNAGASYWALDKIMDIKGNFLTIDYLKDENQLYPSNIYYTTNEQTGLSAKYRISFIYDEPRQDITLSYVLGASVKTTKRLKTIEIFFDNSLLRKYNFEYTTSPSTQRSLLFKVTEYGSDGITSAKPIIFTYSSNGGNWSGDQPKWHIPDGDFIKSGQDQGRRLYDLNADGLTDFIVSRYDSNEPAGRQELNVVHLNSKDGFSSTPNWKPLPAGHFTYDTRDDGSRLVDLNGDGMPALLIGKSENPNFGFFPLSQRDIYSFVNGEWVKGSGSPIFVYERMFDGGVRFGDLNGDGLNDESYAVDEVPYNFGIVLVPRIVATGITGHFSSSFSESIWNSPDGYYVTSVGDCGRRLADINGDGLADFLVADGSYKATYLNNGFGWTRDDTFNIPDGSFTDGGRDQGRMIVDINGDGLNDLVIARAGYHATYINTGYGWKRDDSFNIPDGDFVDSEGKDQGRYLADLNGDGLTDICIAKDGYKKAYLNLAGPFDLLVKVSNGLGGETNIEYAPSSAYDNYSIDTKVGRLPFVIQVVSKITLSDGQGNSYITTYYYKDGYFRCSRDAEYQVLKREFRGFGYVRVMDADGNYTENYFHQDDIYKGRLYRQEIKDKDGNLYSKTENTWQYTKPFVDYTAWHNPVDVYFPYLAQTDNYLYDGDASYKQTRARFEYDSCGNIEQTISEGDVETVGDEKTQVTLYNKNFSECILSTLCMVYIKDTQGNLVSEKKFYYDGNAGVFDVLSKGLLTKEEYWLYNPLTEKEERFSIQYEYDEYGNIVRTIDPLGRATTIIYDSVYHAYPAQTVNVLGHTVRTVYYGINEESDDPIKGYGLAGQVKYIQDPNNQRTYNIYDTLGRLIKVVGPNDTEAFPGVIYEYDLDAKPVKVTKKIKSDYSAVPNYLTVYQFSDGLGRIIQAKSPAENDPLTGQERQIVSGIVKFDQRGKIKEKYLPYFVNSSSSYATPDYVTSHSTFTYDATGRLIQITNPDSTYSSIAYSDWLKTLTDENGHHTTEYYDAYGRIIKIEERNGSQVYLTTYEYDTQGNLIKVIDDKHNISQIWYDSLGRKIAMDDPDMGHWAYEYDTNGNLTKQTDAKSQVITFEHDALNRLKKKLSGTISVEYFYDDAVKPNCIGRISKVTDQSGSTEFFYDNLGREIKSIKMVTGSGSYSVERTYDALDRLVNLTYPDNSIVKYEYNPQGLTKVTDVTAQRDYVSNIDYSPTNQTTKIQYDNGLETTYAYDPDTLRLSNLITQSPSGKIQDFAYQFDKIGNIRNISDYVNTATQSFIYDDLNRLIQASGSYGGFTYDYDSIGNMIYKEGASLAYGKAGRLPHAVVQFDNVEIDYDANGNMIKKGGLEFGYDAQNRLIKVEEKNVTQFISLSPGWNFVSLFIVPQDNKIGSVLSSMAGKYDQVSRYNATTQRFEHYIGNSRYDQFDTLEYGKGYQIYVTASEGASLTITGSVPTNENVSLKTGYNLIFAPNKEAMPVEQVLKPLQSGIDYEKVLSYNKDANQFIQYPGGSLTQLEPGKAYYLKCLKDTAWAVQNSQPITEFVYDGDGGRVKKVMPSSTTTYIGSLFEKDSDGTTRRHVFAGPDRVCTILSADKRYFNHTDHIASSNVITDTVGSQAGLTEFTPYGLLSKQTGTYDPHYKFTGKELDVSTGLYYYSARYYDPQIGRFITPDTIVQAPYDPQSLNRYSYCHNNPINLTDPTGHSWKKFWHKVENFFKDEIRGPLISAAVAFVFSGFNPVAAVAAGISTATLDTGEGRQFMESFGNEIFDDVLGMRPGTAYIWSAIVSNTVLTLGLETTFANLLADPAIVSQNGTQLKDLENPKGYKPFGRYPGGEGNKGFGVSQTKTLTNRAGESLAVVGKGVKSGGLAKVGLDPFHTGAITKNFPGAGMKSIVPDWMYGTLFGTCHQATNATLLSSGISNTVAGIFPHWSTYLSTAVYGNYGGGLMRSVATGIDAYQDY